MWLSNWLHFFHPTPTLPSTSSTAPCLKTRKDSMWKLSIKKSANWSHQIKSFHTWQRPSTSQTWASKIVVARLQLSDISFATGIKTHACIFPNKGIIGTSGKLAHRSRPKERSMHSGTLLSRRPSNQAEPVPTQGRSLMLGSFMRKYAGKVSEKDWRSTVRVVFCQGLYLSKTCVHQNREHSDLCSHLVSCVAHWESEGTFPWRKSRSASWLCPCPSLFPSPSLDEQSAVISARLFPPPVCWLFDVSTQRCQCPPPVDAHQDHTHVLAER